MIDKFEGRYRFLSNFYPSSVKLDGEVYPTVEHAYQAAKTLKRGERKRIREAETAGNAKKLGRKLKLRPWWDSMRLEVMESLLRQKFRKGQLRQALLDTGNEELVEGNWWGDTYWGVCNGRGENHLGKLLMKIRKELRNEEKEGRN